VPVFYVALQRLSEKWTQWRTQKTESPG
jgi:hypothetical protein